MWALCTLSAHNFTQPLVGCNTRSVFKQNTIGLNLVFPSCQYHIKVTEPSLPYYFLVAEKRRYGSMSFSRALVQCKINSHVQGLNFACLVHFLQSKPLHLASPVGWSCRICQLHLCRGVRFPQWVSCIWH